MKHHDPHQPEFGDYVAPRLPDGLRARGIRSVYASYWLAYKLVFLARGRVAATPLGTGARGMSRIASLRETVDADPDAGFLLYGEDAERFGALLEAEGIEARAEAVDAYTLFTGVGARLRRQVAVCRCIPTPLKNGAIALLRAEGPTRLATGEVGRYRVGVRNASSWTLSNNVHLSYHWLRADGSAAVWDGDRTYSNRWPDAGREGEVEIEVRANVVPGNYRLVFDVVDESVAWLGRAAGPLPEVNVEVAPP
jgi:hypothetical protein